MKILTTKSPKQVLALGILAGMRSMSALAVASRILIKHHNKSIQHSPLKFMQSGVTSNILSVMAIGEFIGDKMPAAPNRIAPSALIGRCISGVLSGAAIYKSQRGKWYIGALLGGTTAVAATFGSFYLRKSLVKNTRFIDPVIGTIEDAVVLGAGLCLAETA